MKKTRKLRRNKKCSYVYRGGGDGYSEENFIKQMRLLTTLERLEKQSDKAIKNINDTTTDTLIEKAKKVVGTKKYDYTAVKEFLPELEEFYKITNSTPPPDNTAYTSNQLTKFLDDLKTEITTKKQNWNTENPLIANLEKYKRDTITNSKDDEVENNHKFYVRGEDNPYYPYKDHLDKYWGYLLYQKNSILNFVMGQLPIYRDPYSKQELNLKVVDVTTIIKNDNSNNNDDDKPVETAGGSRKTRRYRKSKAKGMKKRSRTKK